MRAIRRTLSNFASVHALRSLPVPVQTRNFSAVRIHKNQDQKKPYDYENVKQILDLTYGNWILKIILACCKFSIPDLFREKKSLHVDDIAKATETNANAMYRTMRALASIGIFKETDKKVFEMTELSELLDSDHPSRMRDYCIMRGSQSEYMAFNKLEYSIKTGKSAFQEAHGMGWVQYLHNDKEEAYHFDRAMQMMTSTVTESLNKNAIHLFKDLKTIVDIGGGNGTLAASLCKNPELKSLESATVFDLEEVVERARQVNTDPKLKFASGDFFDKIDLTADAYMMKSVCHDWGDEDCLRIFTTIRKSMLANTTPQEAEKKRLLIVEMGIPEDNKRHHVKFSDILMMVFCDDGAKERTVSDFEELLAKADFKITRVVPLGVRNINVIEAQPVFSK